jgi:hypothetical protein
MALALQHVPPCCGHCNPINKLLCRAGSACLKPMNQRRLTVVVVGNFCEIPFMIHKSFTRQPLIGSYWSEHTHTLSLFAIHRTQPTGVVIIFQILNLLQQFYGSPDRAQTISFAGTTAMVAMITWIYVRVSFALISMQ